MKSLYVLKGASAIAAALFCIPIALAAATDKASPTVTAALPSVDNSAISAKLRADPLLSVDMNRGEIVSRLMTQWQGELAAPQRESFKDKLSALRADRLLAVSLVGTFDGVLEVLNGQEKTNHALTALSALKGGDTSKAIGDPDKDLVYTPITPCRILDTRPSEGGPGALAAESTNTFNAVSASFASQGGAATNCNIPSTATAMAGSFAMLNAQAGGHVKFWAAGTAQPNAATGLFNPSSQVTYALNSTIVPLCTIGACPGRQFNVFVSGSLLNVSFDVSGYFAPPSSTGNGLRVIQGGFGPTVVNGAANNTATGGAITVSGGVNNAAAGDYGTIGGGRDNSTATFEATVAGGRANAATGGASAIGGGYGNTASGGSSTVSGGVGNVASGDFSHVGGGGGAVATCFDPVSGLNNRTCGNRAEGSRSTISGGESNLAQGSGATVGGGISNNASGFGFVGAGTLNIASGAFSSVPGGYGNHASGYGSTVPGGEANVASGVYSFAAGQFARALHNNAFVWGDGGADFASTADSTFNVRARGGARFVTATDGAGNATRTTTINSNGTLDFGSDTRQNINLWGSGVYGIGVQAGTQYFRTDISNIVANNGGFSWHGGGSHDNGPNEPGAGGVELMRLAPNGRLFVKSTITANSFLNTSDRNVKSLFENVNAKAILAKVAALPISKWVYSADDKKDWHIGPMAQDFRKAFGLGQDDKTIATVDADGIALAAIQGLHQLVNEKDAKIGKLERANEAMKRQLAAIMRKLGM